MLEATGLDESDVLKPLIRLLARGDSRQIQQRVR